VTEFTDLSQASIFSLPRFDPERELRMLQNLWLKRRANDPPPLVIRSTEITEEVDDHVSDTSTERSFFESDSDEDDEETTPKK
jgi:chorismate mutase